MKTHPNELVICYNPATESHKRTVAFARSMNDHVHELPYGRDGFTTTIWRDIIGMLGISPKDLLNKADPAYQEKIRGADFDDEGWLNVLMANPQLIKAPIAIWKNKALLCLNPSDIYRLG